MIWDSEDILPATPPWPNAPLLSQPPRSDANQPHPVFGCVAELLATQDAQDFHEALGCIVVQDDFLAQRQDLNNALRRAFEASEAQGGAVSVTARQTWIGSMLPFVSDAELDVVVQLLHLLQRATQRWLDHLAHTPSSAHPVASSQQLVDYIYEHAPDQELSNALLGGLKADLCFFALWWLAVHKPSVPSWLPRAAFVGFVENLRHHLRLIASLMPWEELVAVQPLDLEAIAAKHQRRQAGLHRAMQAEAPR